MSGIVRAKGQTDNFSYSKHLPSKLFSQIGVSLPFLQGLFDGDGSYWSKSSPIIYLATDPKIDYKNFIQKYKLIPTLTSTCDGKSSSYRSLKSNSLQMIRFAPGSLVHANISNVAERTVDQMNLFLEAAQHSIRPDKIQKLIEICDLIMSNSYGTYRTSKLVQAEIRDFAQKSAMPALVKKLKKQYFNNGRIKREFYPCWSSKISKSSDIWDFFHSRENLVDKTT